MVNKMASSVDPDEMAHYEPSHQDLHCLHRYLYQSSGAGLGGSVGCAVRQETRRSRVQPPPRSATFFHGD